METLLAQKNRIAAICLVVGSAAGLFFRMMHGDVPAGDPHAALQFIGAHPFYAGVHLGEVLSVILSVIGFVLLSSTLTDRKAVLVSWLAVAVLLVGAAVHVVDFTIDGHAGQTLANVWQTASPLQRTELEQAAGTVYTALHGPALVSISLLWGLATLLFAWAVRHEQYPSWLHRTGVIASALTCIAALAQYLHADLVPGFLIFGLLVLLVQIWTICLGATVFRRNRHGAA